MVNFGGDLFSRTPWLRLRRPGFGRHLQPGFGRFRWFGFTFGSAVTVCRFSLTGGLAAPIKHKYAQDYVK